MAARANRAPRAAPGTRRRRRRGARYIRITGEDATVSLISARPSRDEPSTCLALCAQLYLGLIREQLAHLEVVEDAKNGNGQQRDRDQDKRQPCRAGYCVRPVACLRSNRASAALPSCRAESFRPRFLDGSVDSACSSSCASSILLRRRSHVAVIRLRTFDNSGVRPATSAATDSFTITTSQSVTAMTRGRGDRSSRARHRSEDFACRQIGYLQDRAIRGINDDTGRTRPENEEVASRSVAGVDDHLICEQTAPARRRRQVDRGRLR